MNKFAILSAAVAVLVPISLSRGDMIQEISVDSVDTWFHYAAAPISDGELRIEQTGLTVVVERFTAPQQEVSEAWFSLVTGLQADNSTGDKAMADFAGGTITIRDPLGAMLLSADIDTLSIEENTTLALCVLSGAGTFDVTGGAWADEFGPKGIVFELTWRLAADIDNFGTDFTAESDVTLTPVPEPAVLSVFAVGGLVLIRRKRKA